ncbi:MAG: glycerol-3-phosphate 1-O-acyltransferase PlsY [Candidatus Limiplasma sp.]|nr:glycerol-3-phosphate 1-O-acyltransferase PlsY [Candidatus Limiplasma sp.]
MQAILLSAAVAAAGYLLGCVSTGILVSSRAGVNIRAVGSHNTGASNVLRVLGLKKGLITFVGDFLKATLACWLGSLLLPGSTFGVQGFGAMLGGLFAILGHNWPCFFGFKGGKGVACSAAVVFFVNPLWGIISIAVCVTVIAITRYISLGSMTMLLCYMVLMCATHWGQWVVCGFTALLLILVVVRHRANITRLLNGTENKIGRKAEDAPSQTEK